MAYVLGLPVPCVTLPLKWERHVFFVSTYLPPRGQFELSCITAPDVRSESSPCLIHMLPPNVWSECVGAVLDRNDWYHLSRTCRYFACFTRVPRTILETEPCKYDLLHSWRLSRSKRDPLLHPSTSLRWVYWAGYEIPCVNKRLAFCLLGPGMDAYDSLCVGFSGTQCTVVGRHLSRKREKVYALRDCKRLIIAVDDLERRFARHRAKQCGAACANYYGKNKRSSKLL